jgi:hypothetical protein
VTSNGFRNAGNNWPTGRARCFPLAQRQSRPLTLLTEQGKVRRTVTATATCAEAAAVASRWGPPVHDATLHAHGLDNRRLSRQSCVRPVPPSSFTASF